MIFSQKVCVDKMLALYEMVLSENREPVTFEDHAWSAVLRAVEEEWSLWSNRVSAMTEAALGGGADSEKVK